MMKVAFLIPITSNHRNWKNILDCYLLNYTFKSFLQTKNNENEYAFYIGFDHDDTFFINHMNELQQIFNDYSIKLHITLYENIPKGHVTIMWNVLYQKAYDDNYDYFFQCGDDIEFRTQNWINDSIHALQSNNNIGVSGPNNVDIDNTTLTQAMVSRKHMELYGYFFPPSIVNYYCDNWISEVYFPYHSFKLNNHYAPNLGGNPRYNIAWDKTDYLNELKLGKQKLNYLQK